MVIVVQVGWFVYILMVSVSDNKDVVEGVEAAAVVAILVAIN